MNTKPKRSVGKKRSKKPLSMRGWVLLMLATLILSMGSAYFISLVYLARQNTLYNNGRWTSQKTKMAMEAMGAVAFVVTRVALSGNKLDLGTWHGYQELMYHEPIAPRRIRFDFQLGDDAYLLFLFNRTLEHSDGLAVRLSRHSALTSSFFRVAASGEFGRKTPLQAPAFGDRWHQFEVAFGKDHNDFECRVDGELVLRESAATVPFQRIGFRGGQNQAMVDNVLIETFDGHFVNESFANVRHAGVLFAAVALAVLAVAMLILKASVRRKGARVGAFILTSIMMNLFLASVAFWWVDHRFLSASYTTDVKYPADIVVNHADASAAIQRIRETYGRNNSSATRILFLGTSQTWGAGAKVKDETFVKLIESKLNALAEDGDHRIIECINCGIPGADSTTLLKLYKTEWINLKPNLVVVNLASNDGSPQQLADNLNAICRMNRQLKIKTLFVLEPNSIEVDAKRKRILRERHDFVEQVADYNHVPIVSMHDYLVEQSDRGFLWWDFVHLSSFGQRLFAERLFDALVRHNLLGKLLK